MQQGLDGNGGGEHDVNRGMMGKERRDVMAEMTEVAQMALNGLIMVMGQVTVMGRMRKSFRTVSLVKKVNDRVEDAVGEDPGADCGL